MLEVSNLTKEFKVQLRSEGRFAAAKDFFNPQYQTKLAVNDISFQIDDGEIVAYIGPNGSGKSTTIKMLSGILTPTSGEVRVNGIIPYENRKKNAQQIGVVFGQRTQLWWDIPAKESLNLMRYIYKTPDKDFRENMETFCDILDLREFLDTPVRQLSLGQRMRVELCASLLHNPSILYLDEPTIGLDIVVKKKLRAFLKEINREKGTTILLTTHDISDIEHLCQRVIVIEKGSVKYSGSLDNLKHIYGNRESLTVKLENAVQLPAEVLPGLEITTQEDGITVSYDSNIMNAMEVINRISEYARIIDFKVLGMEIEDVIANIYQQGEVK